MSALQIIGAPQSNYVWTCRIAAAEKGVPYEHVSARPHTPEVNAVNPTGKIPGMRHGEITLGESKAICTYIDRAFAGPGLIPASAEAAALVEQWISIVNTTVDPVLMRQYLVAYLFPGTADGKPDRARIEAALPKMPALFDLLDKQVARTGYLAGPGFTLADAFIVPILGAMMMLPESKEMLTQRKSLAAYLGRMMERPSVSSTKPPPRA